MRVAYLHGVAEKSGRKHPFMNGMAESISERDQWV